MADNFNVHVENLKTWINESTARREIWDNLHNGETVEAYCSKHAYVQSIIGDIVREILGLEVPYVIKRIHS
jgi:hypothetical protein